MWKCQHSNIEYVKNMNLGVLKNTDKYTNRQ